MVNLRDILDRLPHAVPFRFVDGLDAINENGVSGHVTFPVDSGFYRGHFPGRPVTPGVILTEAMAQIGVACLGIFLLDREGAKGSGFAMTSSEIEFLKPVYPGERVDIVSEKIYFRFGKLKCRVSMKNAVGIEVANGTIAGILLDP